MATRADTAFALSESTISQEFLELPRRSPRIQARRKRKADEDFCDDLSRTIQLPKKDSMRGKINRRIRTATRKIADKVAKKLLNEAQNVVDALSKDKDEEKVVGGSSEGRRSADAFNIDVHEPEAKRQKTVSTAKKVICKSLKVFATIPIELTVAAGVGQYKAQFTFRKTPEQRQREVRESILCSPARRAITFDERDEDVFSPRRAISSRRISHGAPRYVDISERYYAPENITIVEEGESAETSIVKDDNDAQVVASTLRGAASWDMELSEGVKHDDGTIVEVAPKRLPIFSLAATILPTTTTTTSIKTTPSPPPNQETPSTSATIHAATDLAKNGEEDDQPPVKIKKTTTPIQRKRQKATLWKLSSARFGASTSVAVAPVKCQIVKPPQNTLLQVVGSERYAPQHQTMHDTVSSFAVLKMRYLNIGVDVFGFGTDLCHTRFGAFIQRLSTTLYENCTNKVVGARIDHGSWSFETRKWSSNPSSTYVEPLALYSNIHQWIVLECLCAEFTVDSFGSLKIKSLSGYFHMENGNWALIDLSDARLGHPLKILRALSDLSPKTHYPWPGHDDPLGCERAAVLLLLGLVPYPNFEPPFYLLARDLLIRKDPRFIFKLEDVSPVGVNQMLALYGRLENLLWRCLAVQGKTTNFQDHNRLTNTMRKCVQMMGCASGGDLVPAWQEYVRRSSQILNGAV
ncbi:unnamed protein product [Oikopleura dioica]|uniref:Uncharacterized protein n=1 Tax=Oikopleura dioica TaxID=34765 RepID=E4YM07_OIKDI|nr:unnamed protein product [Oikopleura dioica]